MNGVEQSGSVDALVVKLLAGSLTGPELELFKETIAALKNDDGAVKIFDNKAKNGREANFQLGVCQYVTSRWCATGTNNFHSQAANGNVIFGIGYYDYKTSVEINRVLFFNWSNTTVDFSKGTHP